MPSFSVSLLSLPVDAATTRKSSRQARLSKARRAFKGGKGSHLGHLRTQDATLSTRLQSLDTGKRSWCAPLPATSLPSCYIHHRDHEIRRDPITGHATPTGQPWTSQRASTITHRSFCQLRAALTCYNGLHASSSLHDHQQQQAAFLGHCVNQVKQLRVQAHREDSGRQKSFFHLSSTCAAQFH